MINNKNVFQNDKMVSGPPLARVIDFFNIYHETWPLIEQGRMLMHYENTTFIYHTEFSKYVKVEEAHSNHAFDYLFDARARKFLIEKRKKYLHELFVRWDSEHLQLDENFDEYLDNGRLEDNIGDEDMQNLNMDD